MPKFHVAPAWYPVENGEFDGSGDDIRADTPKQAAQDYVELNLANLDYPQECQIRTREIGSDETRVWDVTIRQVPDAYAVENKAMGKVCAPPVEADAPEL